jgi:hypothetical protein
MLHRVVGCYPDYERLLQAAAEHARRLVILSYPPRNAISRLLVAAQNLSFRLLRKEFRTFTHPGGDALRTRDTRTPPHLHHHGFVWHVAALER